MQIEYKVKWKGYSEKHNTWEPPCSFTDRSLLRDYHEQVRVRNLQKDLYLADIAGPSGTSTSRKDKHSSTTRKKVTKEKVELILMHRFLIELRFDTILEVKTPFESSKNRYER